MKEIKKIAKYLGIFVVCLIVFDVLFGLVMDRFWNNMPDTVSQTAKTNTFLNKAEADVIILGSSRAAHHYVSSILEDSLGASVYNCGREGMDLIFCDAALEAIINRRIPKIVILDMTERFLKGEDQGRLDGLAPYIKTNPYVAGIMKELKGNSYYALRLSNMYRYNDRLLNMVNAYISTPELYKGYTPLVVKSSVVGKSPEVLAPIKESEVDELEVAHLIHLIEACEAKEIQLYIVNSPSYNIVDNAMAYTKSILSGKNVLFLDYSDLLLEKPEMFMDPDHLLAEGAEIFSEKLASYLARKTQNLKMD